MARLALAGDAMLGRGVGRAIREHGPGHVGGDAGSLLAGADAARVNLECVPAEGGEPEPGRTFHLQAPLAAVDALLEAGVDAATLANNHALDLGGAGLAEALERLAGADLPAPGAGRLNLSRTSSPRGPRSRPSSAAAPRAPRAGRPRTIWRAPSAPWTPS